MAAKPRMCMMCGLQEVETSAICPTCQEGVKREALGQQSNLKHQAEREMRRHGVNPESTPRSDTTPHRQTSEDQ